MFNTNTFNHDTIYNNTHTTNNIINIIISNRSTTSSNTTNTNVFKHIMHSARQTLIRIRQYIFTASD